MPRKPAARLLIADDHQVLADAIKSVLEPEFEVLAVVTDGRSLVKSAIATRPDVVILDISMPQLNGLDAAEQIKDKLPLVKLVFLTMNSSAEVAAEAFRRGASAFVLKQSAADELLAAVRKVVRGESYLSPLIARETVTFLLNSAQGMNQGKRITKRQSEILQLLAEGKSMKEVAAILDLKPGTVAFHKYKMMESLGIKTNAELLEYAIRHNMAPGQSPSLQISEP
jgi:DNA-binding NarL/FixJ family response regulator